jgi:hypothetical protein
MKKVRKREIRIEWIVFEGGERERKKEREREEEIKVRN